MHSHEVAGDMGRLGRKLRIGAGCGVALLCGVLAHGPASAPPDVASPPPSTVVPLVDLDRLYDLDFLVLEGGEARLALELEGPAPAQARLDAVPEPGGSLLWILGFTVVCTLYLPSRSW